MSQVLNNVNVEAVKATIARLKNDSSSRKTKQVLSGEWNIDSSKPQFVAWLKTEREPMIKVESDQSIAQGGKGLTPNPIHYCLYGIASCFAATLATIAALEQITIKKLKVDVSADINSSRIFGLSEEPIIERVSLLIDLELENGGQEQARRLIDLAEARCPAAYTLTHGTKLEVWLSQH